MRVRARFLFVHDLAANATLTCNVLRVWLIFFDFMYMTKWQNFFLKMAEFFCQKICIYQKFLVPLHCN